MPPPPRLAPPHAKQPHTWPHTPYEITSNVTEALQNPYIQSSINQFHNPYTAHYANAYLQSQQVVRTTPEGYTLSLTYDTRMGVHQTTPQMGNFYTSSSTRGRGQGHRSNATRQPTQQNSSWYQPGSAHCTYPGCSFSGSSKSVEIHMMDRHLIFPPSWSKKKKGSDWDADPSLKGKAIPIQGTSVVLNTPEAVEAWLAERKKRWPTAQRVGERRKKMEEAVARGQLPLMNGHSRGTKRRLQERRDVQRTNKRFQRTNVPQTRPTEILESVPGGVRELSSHAVVVDDSFKSTGTFIIHGDESDDEDGLPETASSKPSIRQGLSETGGNYAITDVRMPSSKTSMSPSKKHAQAKKKEPRLPPRNPFASRPTLLRNLLLPEIRMTVSNLSQAIRFLVDNDFFRDVELEPGQAEHNLIEVLDSESSGVVEAGYKSVCKP